SSHRTPKSPPLPLPRPTRYAQPRPPPREQSPMRWPLSEYVLKGIFLGLLLFAALGAPDPTAAGRVGLWLAGGLGAGLLVAAVLKLRQGFRPAGRPLTFLLFLLLESPTLVYAGSILGLAVGAFRLQPD